MNDNKYGEKTKGPGCLTKPHYLKGPDKTKGEAYSIGYLHGQKSMIEILKGTVFALEEEIYYMDSYDDKLAKKIRNFLLNELNNIHSNMRSE